MVLSVYFLFYISLQFLRFVCIHNIHKQSYHTNHTEVIQSHHYQTIIPKSCENQSNLETYVRPTPTYTASFSTNELTLTASITSITNAHNSFAITLERDDGTVLQTHTLADGKASFTFTQTETSYATFNYIVKVNGTQTDA